MAIKDLLLFLWGISFFIYGINLFGETLKKFTDKKKNFIFSKIKKSPLFALFTGIVLTSLLQSSSAVTVMAIESANAMLITSNEIVTLIMGSNIGTSITAFLVACSQKYSAVSGILNIENLAPLFAFFGAFTVFFSKKNKVKGNLFFSVGLFFYGIINMTKGLYPLCQKEWFASFLTMFDNPFLTLAIGILLTAIVQSSSATVGILQTLSLSGNIGFYLAFPIIIGENIGTCITAFLSCIKGNKEAKSTAFIHFYFNLLGGAGAMFIYFILRYIICIDNFSIGTTEIAFIHFLFNVFSVLLLYPFRKYLVDISKKTVNIKKPFFVIS
ncbi:MAG: Na/Pi cotransporter family protein [Acutalibacteraceae bacterium]